MQECRAPAVGCVEVNLGMLHLHTHPPSEPVCRAAKQSSRLCCGSGGQDRTFQILKDVTYLRATHYFKFSLCPGTFFK